MTAKPYRIEWRPMAREDLRGIVRYIDKGGLKLQVQQS